MHPFIRYFRIKKYYQQKLEKRKYWKNIFKNFRPPLKKICVRLSTL